ncbi:hypothetical protein KIH86_08485 [Paenibacillus sp. HN-1]|uniref:hypothetical protein n=1 Tax=Paenibacillus TaxID=44249 RepID=UPI001CA910B4|nr:MULTISPECIES: hypothetical protein [Paenibacillus]MBY9079587.1 hypothetical protein [Paenibacillus sp. CGMCC 1.18879]MBY9084276.1 hypothetical protein [Paenibacillus sinensis]
MNVYRSVTALIVLLLMLVFTQPISAAAASADNSNSTDNGKPNLSEQIQQHSETFDPDALGKRMEQKATELQVVVVGGSKLYIIGALIVFGVLLFFGLFFRRLISAAFVFLALAFLGFLIMNYWPQIVDFILAFLKWVFGKGGSGNEAASGL